MDGTIGSIQLFGGTFSPRNWIYCQGKVLGIADNQSLYSILGTNYGGDGRTNFCVPDLRGRAAVGTGSGPGLTPRDIGNMFGGEYFGLSESQMPRHTHVATVNTQTQTQTVISNVDAVVTVKASDKAGTTDVPTDAYWAVGHALAGKNEYPLQNTYSSSENVTMAPDAVKIDLNSVSAQSNSESLSTIALGTAGESKLVHFLQPSTAIPYIVCVNGEYPQRS